MKLIVGTKRETNGKQAGNKREHTRMIRMIRMKRMTRTTGVGFSSDNYSQKDIVERASAKLAAFASGQGSVLDCATVIRVVKVQSFTC